MPSSAVMVCQLLLVLGQPAGADFYHSVCVCRAPQCPCSKWHSCPMLVALSTALHRFCHLVSSYIMYQCKDMQCWWQRQAWQLWLVSSSR